MLFAKLKGISLGIGVMTAVVSGAVVLAQSGPGPQAGGGANTTVTYKAQLPSKDESSPSRADRTAIALEKKLDRILEALDRLSQPALNLHEAPPLTQLEPAPSARSNSVTVDSRRPLRPSGAASSSPALATTAPSLTGPSVTSVESEVVEQAAAAEYDEVPSADGTSLAGATTARARARPMPVRQDSRTIADRLGLVEQKLAKLQADLDSSNEITERLLARLGELEKQLGANPPPTPSSSRSIPRRR